MNERDLLMQVLKGEMPEKKPWFADLSYLYTSLKIKGELEDKYEGDGGYLQFHKDLGAGIFVYAPFVWKTEYTGGVSFTESEVNGVRTSIYHTPKGVIRATEKYLPIAYTWAYFEHFVKSIGDLRIMAYIFENTKYVEDYDGFNKIDHLWANDGIPTCLAPISVSPMQKLLSRWAGIEKTIEIFTENTGEFEEILERIQVAQAPVFDIITRSSAQYVEFAENLSSEITGKPFFEKYNMPYYIKIINQLHKTDKYVGIHIDGTLSGCLPLLGECGFDVAEAVTPSPLGDIDVEDLRSVAGDKIVIWGGIPGALFSDIYSDELFVDHVTQVLRTFKDDARFVLGVADQIPPDGMISRIKKVRELVETSISD
jgi:hypothetical protein